MKKWLRIILIITCLIGVTSLLGQAKKRKTIIQSAAIHDQSGRVVESIPSHQPQEVQMALTLDLPAGDTVIALADQDQAEFVPGEITELEAAEGITAEVDQQKQLKLNNSQDKAQQVELLVPIKLANPLLISDLELKLLVVDKSEKFKLAKVAVTSEEDEDAEEAAKESSKVSSSDDSKDQNSSNDNDAVTSSSQSGTQPSASPRVKKAETDNSDQATEPAKEEAVKQPETKASKVATPQFPSGAGINVHRAQVQVGSWSDSLIVGGSLLAKDNVKLHEKVYDGVSITSGGYYVPNSFEDRYHVSYMRKGDIDGPPAGEKAYAVAVSGKPEEDKDDDIYVYYSNVGAYTDSASADTPTEPMGAIVKISNIKYHKKITGKDEDGKAFIDFSNNFYSGMVYNGIETLDMDVTFTTSDWSQALVFPDLDINGDARSYFTFGSLNGNKPFEHEWAGSRLELPGKVAPGAKITYRGEGWYEGTGVGVTNKETYDGKYGPADWGDYLGSSDYELGAVSFPLVGQDQLFKLKSESGFTWQSFSSGYVMPLEPEAPQKRVHRTEEVGLDNNNLDGVTVDRDNDNHNVLYYTIYQKTYSIPNDSIAKPNAITLRDQLPAGLKFDKDDVELFNTDGKRIPLKGPMTGDIKISDDGKLTYKFSEKEIEALTFDGKSFAIRIKTTIIDDNFVGTFKNRASVTFNSGKGYTWRKRTNEVVTHFKRGTYQFQKVDGTTGKALANAEFVIQNAKGQYLTFNSNGLMTGLVDRQSKATTLAGDDNGHFKVTGLPHGDYKLIETKAPDGYVNGGTHDFTVSNQAQATPAKIQNDPYSLPVTGGHGIIWVIVAGLILVLSSLAIWRAHPRGG